MRNPPYYIFLLLFSLSSCAYYALVPGNSTTTVAGSYNVKIDTPWNARALGDAHLWTQHGAGLDHFFFFPPAEDGKPPINMTTQQGKEMPKYKKGMTYVEFPELLKVSLTNLGYMDIQLARTEPSNLGDARGLRMDFSMKTENGPKLKCFALMGVKNDRMYSLLFMAEETTYFPMVAPTAEKVVASLTLVQ